MIFEFKVFSCKYAIDLEWMCKFFRNKESVCINGYWVTYTLTTPHARKIFKAIAKYCEPEQCAVVDDYLMNNNGDLHKVWKGVLQ